MKRLITYLSKIDGLAHTLIAMLCITSLFYIANIYVTNWEMNQYLTGELDEYLIEPFEDYHEIPHYHPLPIDNDYNNELELDCLEPIMEHLNNEQTI